MIQVYLNHCQEASGVARQGKAFQAGGDSAREIRDHLAVAGAEAMALDRRRDALAAPVLFAQLAMGRICADFCAAWPDVEFAVVAEDRLVDLVEEQFDVAIRPNPRPDASLVGRPFAKDRMVVVAAPAHPMPAAGGPVTVPGILMTSLRSGTWSLDGGRLVPEPVPRLRFSSFLTIRDAAVAGAGVALWVLHTSRRLPTPKVRTFVDFMCSRYPEGLLALRG